MLNIDINGMYNICFYLSIVSHSHFCIKHVPIVYTSNWSHFIKLDTCKSQLIEKKQNSLFTFCPRIHEATYGYAVDNNTNRFLWKASVQALIF